MWNSPAFILTQLLALGASSLLTPGQTDCLTISTTTIYRPTTVYIPSPPPTWESSSCNDKATTLVSAIRSSSHGLGSTKALTSPLGALSSPGAISRSTVTPISVQTSASVKTPTPMKSSTSLRASAPLGTSTILGTPTPTGNAGGKTFKNIAYFTNWGIYGRNYQPQDLPADQLTHVLHAFANINREDGTVYSADAYADLEKRYAGDGWGEPGRNAYGIAKQLYLQKQRHRRLKTLLSVGGWTFSANFMPMAGAEAPRRNFARSAVALVADWGLDGIDIDWEYPRTAAEAQAYVLLLAACRAALDDYAAKNDIRDSSGRPYHFLLTVATAAGPTNYQKMDLKGMDKYIDTWHLMSYDYAGSWSDLAGHASNLFASNANSKATPFSTDTAVQYYLAQGIRPEKILLGLPIYGRSFEHTEGLGKPYQGVGWSSGAGGNWEAGVWDYKVLPRPGATEYYDDVAKAAYSYAPSGKELISYDNVRSATDKASYIKNQKGLGGAFFWEASGDRLDDRSLIKTMASKLGNLEASENNLRYPTSQYDNIRNGMPP